jgi:outer membrane protein assembly factor BamB
LGHDSNLFSSPTIADLDGDGSPEIIFGTQGGRVVAVRANGTLMWSRSTGSVSVAKQASGCGHRCGRSYPM